MFLREDTLALLRKYFDLNLYEVRIWTALLSKGVATAGELSDLANVPRSRTYDVLESLEKKGFVVQKIGKPIKYIAVPPEEVLERAKKNFFKEAEERAQLLDKIKDSELMEELKQLHNKGVETLSSQDLTASLRGRHNIYNHLETMFKAAEETITIMTTSSAFLRKVETFEYLFRKLKERGVVIRIAVNKSEDKEAREAASRLKDIAEVRETDINARFVIVDSKELMMMLNDDNDVHPTYDIGVWLNTPFLARSLEELFEKAWEGMERLN